MRPLSFPNNQALGFHTCYTVYAGRKQQMRNQLLSVGSEGLTDLDLLEMLFGLALPKRDARVLGAIILSRFGSIAAAVAASPADLRAINGIGNAGVAALKIVHAAAVKLSRHDVIQRPVLSDWDRLMTYLNVLLAHERVETLHVLFLNHRNRLLADETLARGTVDALAVYPRELLRRALELSATALILTHNRPCGDPTPSADDIDLSRTIKSAAATLSIELHDHVIVANGVWVSLRQEGLL